jgi:pentatricopeptide repeat protein
MAARAVAPAPLAPPDPDQGGVTPFPPRLLRAAAAPFAHCSEAAAGRFEPDGANSGAAPSAPQNRFAAHPSAPPAPLPAGALPGPPLRARARHPGGAPPAPPPRAARDMDALKAAVLAARPRAGEVAAAIRAAQFAPRSNAFTSLLQAASKARLPDHAVELFDAMEAVAGVRPNVFHCASSRALGRPVEAENVPETNQPTNHSLITG